jgi:hypothetical protein
MVGVRADQLDKIEAILPDDDTGKVTIEQLVATYNAVHESDYKSMHVGLDDAFAHLRSVKPT